MFRTIIFKLFIATAVIAPVIALPFPAGGGGTPSPTHASSPGHLPQIPGSSVYGDTHWQRSPTPDLRADLMFPDSPAQSPNHGGDTSPSHGGPSTPHRNPDMHNVNTQSPASHGPPAEHGGGHTSPSPSGPSTGAPHSPGYREYYDPSTNTFHWAKPPNPDLPVIDPNHGGHTSPSHGGPSTPPSHLNPDTMHHVNTVTRASPPAEQHGPNLGGQATSGTPSTNKGKERAHPEPQNTPPPPPAEHHGSNLGRRPDFQVPAPGPGVAGPSRYHGPSPSGSQVPAHKPPFEFGRSQDHEFEFNAPHSELPKSPSTEEKSEWRCDNLECHGQIFSTQLTLKQHQNTAPPHLTLDSQVIQCTHESCGRSFPTDGVLKEHQNSGLYAHHYGSRKVRMGSLPPEQHPARFRALEKKRESERKRKRN